MNSTRVPARANATPLCVENGSRPGTRRRAADYLRHVLVANAVLPVRDEALAATERFLTDTLAGVERDNDRRLAHAYATWRVLRRLRRSAERGGRPRTYTRHAHVRIGAAARFLAWLAARGATLAEAGQADVDAWLAGGRAAYDVRDFLLRAADNGHARPLVVPALSHHPGHATGEDDRWALIARLLHDDSLELTDLVAGALLLLYAQRLSRITAMTTDQLTRRGDQVFLRFGRDDVAVPEPLAGLLVALVRDGRRHVGVGSPANTRWLFPGHLPGRPLTASRLGQRLGKPGIHGQSGRRAALLSLANQLPAAVLADLLNLTPTTAVGWVHDAGGDWSRYAAELAQARSHQP